MERFPFDAGLQEANARILWMDGGGEHFADAFLAAVAARPGDLSLRLKCADLLRLADNHAAAEQLLRDGVKRDPRDPTLAATLGILLDERGQLEEALSINSAVAQAFPHAAALQLNLAHTLLRLGRGRDALAVVAPIRAAIPDLQQAITYEGMALKQTGDPRHDWLCNYKDHVQAFDLDTPPGFADIAAFNAALSASLRGMLDAGDHPLDQSLRWGAQTSYNLKFSDDPVIRAYFTALEAPVTAYINGLPDDAAHPLVGRKTGRFAFSGGWSVLLRPGGFHVNHTHPEGWISSSYYVSLPASHGWRVGSGRLDQVWRAALAGSRLWHRAGGRAARGTPGAVPLIHVAWDNSLHIGRAHDCAVRHGADLGARMDYARGVKGEIDQRPKRFYTLVEVAGAEEGWIVTLDGRAVRTPGGKRLALPSEKLAQPDCG